MNDRDIGRSPEPPDEKEEKTFYEIEKEKLGDYLWAVLSTYDSGNDRTFAGRHRAINLIMHDIDHDEPYVTRY